MMNPWFHVRGWVVSFAVAAVLSARPAAADMTIHFVNSRPDAQAVPACITFGGGGMLDGTNRRNSALLALGTSYPLSGLGDGMSIKTFTSGRIFVSIGAGLTRRPKTMAIARTSPTRTSVISRRAGTRSK
jgi:hypothetical protein